MKIVYYRFALSLLLYFILFGTLFSCVNDLETIKKITHKPTDPDERTQNLKIIYSDSGFAKIEIFAKVSETFTKPSSIVKLSDSVEVKFFDEKGKVISVLTALRGEIDQKNGKIFVKDSVELYNFEKDQRLKTEILYWNQKDSSIFTDKLVTIRTPKVLFYGQGVRTKQDFSTYEFVQPRGQALVKDLF